MAGINSKKAMLMEVIIATAVLVLGFIAVMALFNKGASKVEDKSAEKLCEASNSARRLAKLDILVSEITTPRVCRTIDKEIPESGYPQTKEGAMANMRELMTKCWKMWLAGEDPEILGGGSCFICYDFSIKKDIDGFKSSEFDISLDKTAYFAEDKSDKCLGLGGGGYCMDECSGDFPRQFRADTKCKLKSQKCCKTADTGDSCINKGGQCMADCGAGDIAFSDDGWQCSDSSKKCCVKRENYFTYRDYIQNYKAAGAVTMEDGLEFEPVKDIYAITFAQNIDGHFLDKAKQFFTGEVPRAPLISFSRLSSVSGFCSAEEGVGG